MDHTRKSQQTVLSIGPGMLGIERGIESVIGQLRVAAYVEIETFVIQNLIAFMEKGVLDPAPVWADLKTFDPAPFHRKIHGIIAGYPCQPFSHAGKRAGTDDPRHLYPYIEKAVRAIRPVWCFFENVEGHLTLGFDQVYQSLRAMGYRVEAGIYSAEEIGAPHVRNRLFILALDDTRHTEWKRGQQAPEGSQTRGKSFPEFAPPGLFSALGEMGNAKGIYKSNDWNQSGKRQRKNRGSGIEKVANSNESGFWRNNENRLHSKIIRSGTEVEHPTFTGRNTGGNEREIQTRHINKPSIENFPLPPGPYQYKWEAPRILEPGVGSSAHGYNFREDLLRMLGNGVVWQTAALAFVDLWNKHLTTK